MLDVRNLVKSYEGKPLLEGISLSVPGGETLCLLGPSGSGKSTLLRIVAGLEAPEGGVVLWNGNDLAGVPAHRRSFGMMFQDYALFPHLNVAGNVGFGLRMKRLSADRIRSEVRDALAQVDLAGFERRRVADLSGGEQQRVALARALAPRPALLLLDEPLGALDRALREDLTAEIRRVLRAAGIPALYVTHDQEEAFAVAARVALLHGGRIVQSGTPAELTARPACAWAAGFLGLGNLLPGRVRSARPLRVETELGEFAADGAGAAPAAGTQGWILLRPAGGEFVRTAGAARGAVRGVVRENIRREEGYRVVLQTASGREILCRAESPLAEGGERIWMPARGLWLAD